MHEKGGMNSAELQKCTQTATFPLHPDIADVPGKRVFMKADSRPGHMNINKLAKLRLKGMCLMPGAPN